MDSIITQVNREDEQLNAFANDKGKSDASAAQLANITQIFVCYKKGVFASTRLMKISDLVKVVPRWKLARLIK